MTRLNFFASPINLFLELYWWPRLLISYHLFLIQSTTIGSCQKHLIFLFLLQNTVSVHFHQAYSKINMIKIKINLILQQETIQRSKGEKKSLSSVSSFTTVLNANDLLKSVEGNGQIKPILKQSRKKNIFSKKYVFSYHL